MYRALEFSAWQKKSNQETCVRIVGHSYTVQSLYFIHVRTFFLRGRMAPTWYRFCIDIVNGLQLKLSICYILKFKSIQYAVRYLFRIQDII